MPCFPSRFADPCHVPPTSHSSLPLPLHHAFACLASCCARKARTCVCATFRFLALAWAQLDAFLSLRASGIACDCSHPIDSLATVVFTYASRRFPIRQSNLHNLAEKLHFRQYIIISPPGYGAIDVLPALGLSRLHSNVSPRLRSSGWIR